MKNQFEEVMAKKTTADLEKVVSSNSGDYQDEAVTAAQSELQKRALFKESVSIYSDEQLYEIINSQSRFPYYEVEIVKEEAEKRGLIIEEMRRATQARITQELNKLQSDVSSVKYSALRFISKVFRIFAWIIAIADVLAIMYVLTLRELGIVIALGLLVGGGILCIIHLALSELIKVFIDIEYNTRIGAVNHR